MLFIRVTQFEKPDLQKTVHENVNTNADWELVCIKAWVNEHAYKGGYTDNLIMMT